MADEPQNQDDLAKIVAEVQGEPEPTVSIVPPEGDGDEPEQGDDPTICMYCHSELLKVRVREHVCDTCHYTSMTVAARIEQVEAEVERMAAKGEGDFSLYQGHVAAAVDTACTLAGSRDERLVRQYAQGLLDGLRIGGKLKVVPFPLEAFQEYAKTAKVWGD